MKKIIMLKYCPECGAKAEAVGRKGDFKSGYYLNGYEADAKIYRCPQKCVAWYILQKTLGDELIFITTPDWVDPVEASHFQRWEGPEFTDEMILIFDQFGSGITITAKLKANPSQNFKLMHFYGWIKEMKIIKITDKIVKIAVSVQKHTGSGDKTIQHESYDKVVILNMKTGEFSVEVENHKIGKEYRI